MSPGFDVSGALNGGRDLLMASGKYNERTGGKVFEKFANLNATVTGLAERPLVAINQMPTPNGHESSLVLQHLESVIAEFSTHFPKHRPKNFHPLFSDEVVLLTGSTGALGSQLLQHLVSSPSVSHVYAFNRRSKDGRSLRDRHIHAFIERGLDVGILDSLKVTLVEGDSTMDDLGIHPRVFSEIRDNITLIIHNAWTVNFFMKFESFRPNIQSVRTLVGLALASPQESLPRILFTSSVTVFKNWNAEECGRPLEISIEDANVVVGCGYTESKFVAERILENAARSTPLHPIIVRIGQLAGPPNGAWNSTDWVPALVASGQRVGVLPARNDCIAWLPLNTAAEVLFEFRNTTSQYLHLAHPNPVPWNLVFEVFSSRLNVPLVSWTEWISRVEMKYGKGALRMLDMFHGRNHSVPLENREAPGLVLMDIRRAISASPCLADTSLLQIGREDAERWVLYWKRLGILSNNGGKL